MNIDWQGNNSGIFEIFLCALFQLIFFKKAEANAPYEFLLGNNGTGAEMEEYSYEYIKFLFRKYFIISNVVILEIAGFHIGVIFLEIYL